MNILTLQIDTDEITMLDISHVDGIDSTLTTAEWLTRSIAITTPSAGTHPALKIGDVIQLPGSSEFKVISTRDNPLEDNWSLTESGLVLRVTINNLDRSKATVTSIYRHPWVFSTQNNMDNYARNFRAFGGGENRKPINLHNISSTNHLSETDYPEFEFEIQVYGCKSPSLQDFKIGGIIWNHMQYSIAGGDWTNYNPADGIPLVAHLPNGADYHMDGYIINVKLRFTHSEAVVHKFRDTYIHNKSGYMSAAKFGFNASLEVHGTVSNIIDGDVQDGLLFKHPFNGLVTVAPGTVNVDTLKVRVVDADGKSTATSINSMARVFQDSTFDGNWLTISPASFANPDGISTSIQDVNDTLPNDAWLALDNGTLIYVSGGVIQESRVSEFKWNGSSRFSSIGGSSAQLMITGDTDITDTHYDSIKFPYPINNMAKVRIVSTGPLADMSISNGNSDKSIPQGTMELYRDQWDTIFGGNMMIGDFYKFENDKPELEKIKQKPFHDYTIDLRKMPGYQFDLNYPTETYRTYTLDVNTSTNVYYIDQGSDQKSQTAKLVLNIRRNLTRWDKYELPRISTHETVWNDDTGRGNIYASRIYQTRYYDMDKWLQDNTEVSTDFGTTPGNNGFIKFENNRTTIETATGPYNTPNVKIYKSISEASRDHGNGGFVRHDGTGWDKSHNYATILYVMRDGPDGPGRYYHGCGWWTTGDEVRELNGTVNANPYFGATNLNNLTRGEWYIAIAFLRNINGTSTVNWGGGLWNTVTGVKLLNYKDYRIGNTGSRRHRSFQFYCPVDGRELHQSGFMDFDMTDRGWSYEMVLDMFVPGRNISAVGLPQTITTRTHPDLSGCWGVEGSLQSKTALNVDGTDHSYTYGMLVESKGVGDDQNQIVLQQSDNALILPKPTLDGGFNGSDKPVVAGGSPGNAIKCVDSATTINNNGTITGNIERI